MAGGTTLGDIQRPYPVSTALYYIANMEGPTSRGIVASSLLPPHLCCIWLEVSGMAAALGSLYVVSDQRAHAVLYTS